MTALAASWGLVFAGTAAGAIVAVRPRLVRDDPVAVAAAPVLEPAAPAAARRAAARRLNAVVALDIAAVFTCHGAPVRGLATVGGLLFSADADAALAAWPRPRPTAGGRVEPRPPRVYAAHEAALTALAPLADGLATADVAGAVLVHAATKYFSGAFFAKVFFDTGEGTARRSSRPTLALGLRPPRPSQSSKSLASSTKSPSPSSPRRRSSAGCCPGPRGTCAFRGHVLS